jgi:Reverse transcriptase (RNA-dependent DNA polymerase)
VNQLSSVIILEKLEEAEKDLKWINTMNVEIDALKKNNTWEITDLPARKNVVGYKWIYTIKYDAQGRIERYKARLVAKKYTQMWN